MNSSQIVHHSLTAAKNNYRTIVFCIFLSIILQYLSQSNIISVMDKLLSESKVNDKYLLVYEVLKLKITETVNLLVIIIFGIEIIKRNNLEMQESISVTQCLKKCIQFIVNHPIKVFQIYIFHVILYSVYHLLLFPYLQTIFQNMVDMHNKLDEKLNTLLINQQQTMQTQDLAQLYLLLGSSLKMWAISLSQNFIKFIFCMYERILIDNPQVSFYKALWKSALTMVSWRSIKIHIGIYLRLWWIWLIFGSLNCIIDIAYSLFYFQECKPLLEARKQKTTELYQQQNNRQQQNSQKQSNSQQQQNSEQQINENKQQQELIKSQYQSYKQQLIAQINDPTQPIITEDPITQPQKQQISQIIQTMAQNQKKLKLQKIQQKRQQIKQQLPKKMNKKEKQKLSNKYQYFKVKYYGGSKFQFISL